MKAVKKHINRFRKNLKQFVKLKANGTLNGSAAAIKEKLQHAAGAVDLDFDKELKKLTKGARDNPDLRKDFIKTVTKPDEKSTGYRLHVDRGDGTVGITHAYSENIIDEVQKEIESKGHKVIKKERINPCGCEARKNPETTPKIVKGACEVTVRAKTNARKGGIEIRFDGEPADSIKDELKAAGYLYFTPKNKPSFWSAKITKTHKKVAENIAGKFDSAVVNLKPKDVKGETSNAKRKKQKAKKISLKSANPTFNDTIGFGVTVENKAILFLQKNYDNKGNLVGPFKEIGTYKQIKSKRQNDFQAWDKALQNDFQDEINELIHKGKKREAKSEKEETKKSPHDVNNEPLPGNALIGNKTAVDFKADGSIQEQGRFALAEISDVQASHNKDCTPNSKHTISRSQPRDRSKEALCAQPQFIAKNLNPASITQGNLAFVGTPVTTVQLQDIQGNGRTIALKIAYDEIPKSAKKYKKYVQDHATDWGFTKKEVDHFKQPVLIRVLHVSTERAIELGNVVDTSQAKMSKIDQAKAYIRNLSESQLTIIGRLIQNSSGETIGAIIDDVGMDIIGQMKTLDRTGIVEKNKLTGEGKDFLRSVLVGLVFDGEQHPNALHHYLKLPHTIKAGLERSFGYIIPLIGNKGDITDTLARGVEIAAQTYQSDAINTAKEYAGSKDMFAAKDFTKQETALAQFLLDASTQKEIRDAFRYYDELLKGKENLFGKTPPKSKKAAFKLVFIDRARPNPSRSADGIIHQTIVHAQRLQNFGHDNSKDLEKLDYLLGSDGWKWNNDKTQIIRLNENISPLQGKQRENPAQLTPDVKRAVLDDFYSWINSNPLMDYEPGETTFKNWIPYHYPGFENEANEIWATARPMARTNPTAKFIYIGFCEKMLIDQGNEEPVTLQGPLAMLTNKAMHKLFIVPLKMMSNFPDEVADMDADEVFENWHHYAPDNTNYSFNWPDMQKSHPVGTADEIYYVSDKIMREWDGKGKLNTYHHEFDAGKRPCLKKGNILIITDLKINENGILN